ncbi:sister chromatid cohesion protein Mis4 [Metarhizium album ARSEF 1941]|uniref:Sister chromatid cohesion protein n=1 Tax=Metarhizium album (strain ARSEF 1941) TaxID=1081103 RepID=A0A0B2WKL6_METAS|nr:sister chromatid cohesion protein Mis4 [Metarhizium album ARSEF 1941]KHN94199.1 sister chromatid cohesion protein Mis4 [Metarhizium album ARSEF 1941]
MDHYNTNGPRNGFKSVQGPGEQNGISRPFTLQESLPYSPQTSTVPFLPDIIPDPSVGSGSPSLRISDLFSTQDYDRVNQEGTSQLSAAKNLKQTVDHVLHDLKPSKRTQYKFPSLPNGTPSSLASTHNKSISQSLSPIAKAVYERVGSFFKATKHNLGSPKLLNGEAEQASKLTAHSVSQSPTIHIQSQALANKNTGSGKTKIEVAISTNQSFDRSQYAEISDDHYDQNIITPHDQLIVEAQQYSQSNILTAKPPIVVNSAGLSIELPSAAVNREEYQEFKVAPDAPENLSVRRKERQDIVDGQDILGTSLDQRQRGEAALDALDALMRQVFSAVGGALVMESGLEHIVYLTDSEPAMTATTQQKMHTAIQKVIGLRSFNGVPLENLLKVMKLSEASLKQAEGLDIRVDESWDEPAVESWVQQLGELETALKAARTCLRIMSGCREDKQLYSEAVITKCVNIYKAVTEDVVMPLVELRNSGSSGALFKLVQKHKKAVASIFVCCQKLSALLAELITNIELSETVINTLEFTASKLIFVENAYFEKDSAIGIQKFDGIRSVAMDMLCQIFLIKPEQRQGIIDDILTSLEKLPVGKLSSRQFKLADGGSIQPVSTLIMRLVQASSGRVGGGNGTGQGPNIRAIGADDSGEDDEDDRPVKRNQATATILSEEQGAQQPAVAIQELEGVAAPLIDTAVRNASYVINFMVKRAMGSTKSGDTPYRNLLDLFVDDFTTCLDVPDWPSAELLLRLLMVMMVQLFEAPKTAAPAKNMALELLGTMSAAISRLRSHVKKSAGAFISSDAGEYSQYLSELATHCLEQRCPMENIVAWAGPYRGVLEYLQERSSEDPHLSSAVSFLISDWATRIHTTYDSIQDNDSEGDKELGRSAFRLRMMIEDRQWLASEYTFKAVTNSQAKFAFSIILLRSPFCESFGKILNILLGSMASDQATVRSKSLKSVNQVLETDPSILDGDSTVIQLILDCASDSSTQVRDSALGLLGSCISMRPALEASLTPKIIDRFQDAGVGVRKRAMKLARDIYLRNRGKNLRSAIANGLLRRVQDPDEGVRDLARQMIEEVWFAPFYTNENTASFETSLAEHVSLVIQTVKGGTVTEILDKVFQTILKPGSKSLDGPFGVCSRLVGIMFGLIDNPESEDPTVPSGRDALQVLTIFAKADPNLFNFEQIKLLKTQLASFTGADELAAFRAVTVIYKRVLPQLPNMHAEFLADVRLQLLKGIGKISSRGALDDLIACAHTVCELLKDFAPLGNLVASSLMGIQKLSKVPLDAKRLHHVAAYSIIVGSVGKHCDLDKQARIFRERFPGWKGDSVPKLIVDILSPFSSPQQPLDARKASIEAIGLVCQSWPRNYDLVKVYTAFQQVFQDKIPILETMILRSFKEFLVTEERRSEAAAEAPKEKNKELTVMGGTNFDDVASGATQRFLKDITRIALSSQDEHAFLAMEVLGSINRQGLTHPKETGVTLITLETSANRKIAELAFMEHRSLHEKHETVLEREYVKAVQSAYNYQRDIVNDSHGATTDPFQSKLHLLMEVLKISKMKNRQRFLEKLVGQADFDLGNLNVEIEMPHQVDFARFIAENLAFLEYHSIGELQTTVHTIEKMVASTGATVAQAIESEVFNVRMDVDQQEQAQPRVEGVAQVIPTQCDVPTVAAPAPILLVEPQRLRQLTAGAMILLSLWEVRSHLRRLFGMGTSRHDSRAKALAKDLNRTPLKVQGVHGERVWDEIVSHMNGLSSQESMVQKCKAFVELMNVDKEFKVAEEDDDMGMGGPGTPSEGEEEEDGGDRGRKRKATGTPGGRKKRARSGSQTRKRGRPRKQSVEHSDDGEFDGDWI